jgi:hypothetical protein
MPLSLRLTNNNTKSTTHSELWSDVGKVAHQLRDDECLDVDIASERVTSCTKPQHNTLRDVFSLYEAHR